MVVIPTYNERANLRDVVSRTLAVPGVRALIVDDASPDGTGGLADTLAAETPRVAVLHRTRDRGFGPSYLAGFRTAMAAGADVICQMDADGSHDPATLDALVAALADADVAQGSRYVPGADIHDWPLSRRLLSRAGNTYVRALMGVGIKDATSGFRAWRRAALQRLPLDRLQARGHAFQVELTHAAVRAGLRIVEVPIAFCDRRRGASKVSMRVFVESLVTPWRLLGGYSLAAQSPARTPDTRE